MKGTAAQRIEAIRQWFHHEELFADNVSPDTDLPVQNTSVIPSLFFLSKQGYCKEEWVYHRSWRRHLPEGFAFVRVLHSLGWPVFFYVAVSLFVCSYAQWAEVRLPLPCASLNFDLVQPLGLFLCSVGRGTC